MKHSLKITLLLIVMFFTTQLIGLYVANIYANHNYDIPFGMDPPKDVTPGNALTSIIFAIIFAVVLMLILMKFKTRFFLKFWFLVVIFFALSIALNAFLMNLIPSSALLVAILIAIPLSLLKVFKRHFLIHNLTELLIYPGIGIIFISVLKEIWVISILLILISIYDIYAVWHAGFMQKMAKYQITDLKIFSGFMIPSIGKKERELINNLRNKSEKIRNAKLKKIKVSLAILGGGDVVFPIILAGIVLINLGFIPALISILGATAGLTYLFYISKKGKFYPAMPFISGGCFIALGLIALLGYSIF